MTLLLGPALKTREVSNWFKMLSHSLQVHFIMIMFILVLEEQNKH